MSWLFALDGQSIEASILGFPGGSVIKNPPAKQETLVQSLAQGDSLEEEMAKPLQYSCLGNPTDREAWRDPSSITIRI